MIEFVGEFKSIKGALYRVELDNKNYDGEPKEMLLGNSPLVLQKDRGDLTDSMVNTKGKLRVISQVNYEYMNLLLEGDFDVRIRIYRDEMLYFEGWLDNLLYEEEYVSAPYGVTIRFTDGLNRLKKMEYKEGGDLSSFLKNVIGIIASILGRLNPEIRKLVVNSSLHHEYFDLDIPAMNQCYMDINNVDKLEVKCYDLLDSLLTLMGCHIYQQGGRWVIERNANKSLDNNEIVVYDLNDLSYEKKECTTSFVELGKPDFDIKDAGSLTIENKCTKQEFKVSAKEGNLFYYGDNMRQIEVIRRHSDNPDDKIVEYYLSYNYPAPFRQFFPNCLTVEKRDFFELKTDECPLYIEPEYYKGGCPRWDLCEKKPCRYYAMAGKEFTRKSYAKLKNGFEYNMYQTIEDLNYARCFCFLSGIRQDVYVENYDNTSVVKFKFKVGISEVADNYSPWLTLVIPVFIVGYQTDKDGVRWDASYVDISSDTLKDMGSKTIGMANSTIQVSSREYGKPDVDVDNFYTVTEKKGWVRGFHPTLFVWKVSREDWIDDKGKLKEFELEIRNQESRYFKIFVGVAQQESWYTYSHEYESIYGYNSQLNNGAVKKYVIGDFEIENKSIYTYYNSYVVNVADAEDKREAPSKNLSVFEGFPYRPESAAKDVFTGMTTGLKNVIYTPKKGDVSVGRYADYPMDWKASVMNYRWYDRRKDINEYNQYGMLLEHLVQENFNLYSKKRQLFSGEIVSSAVLDYNLSYRLQGRDDTVFLPTNIEIDLQSDSYEIDLEELVVDNVKTPYLITAEQKL